MKPIDIYFHVTDRIGGMHVEQRRAWDAPRLTQAVIDLYTKEGGTAVRITSEEYLAARRAA